MSSYWPSLPHYEVNKINLALPMEKHVRLRQVNLLKSQARKTRASNPGQSPFKQNCKCVLLSIPGECELSPPSFLIGMEKNTCIKLSATHRETETLLICSRKRITHGCIWGLHLLIMWWTMVTLQNLSGFCRGQTAKLNGRYDWNHSCDILETRAFHCINNVRHICN